MRSLILALLFVPAFAFAQTVDIEDAGQGTSDDDTTTIQISKSKKTKTVTETSTSTEVDEGEKEIEGEPGNLTSEAKANWKTACEEWKKEIKSENKGSRVTVDCGKSTCTTDAVNKVCSSTGKYKIRTTQKN